MKLNKVMALALSGLMAVSMLAGCAGDPSNGDGGNTEVTPPASDAVSIMNEAQSLVKFEADADFDALVAAAAAKATYKDASAVSYTVGNPVNGDAVYTELNKKLPANEDMQYTPINFASSNKPGTATTQTVLFLVKSNGLTKEAALKQVADKMADNQYPSIVTNRGNYKAAYTGNVSIVTVDCTDGGKTASAYYIAVQVTQTVANEPTV